MKNKTKLKINKYKVGTQQVIVPDAGSLDTIAGPTMGLAQTGGNLGNMLGPIGGLVGTGVGALAGGIMGISNYNKANRQHNLAVDQNKYIHKRNNIAEDPKLMQMQTFKKGTKGVKTNRYKYPGGTQGIQLSLEEKKHLNSLKQTNPEAYKKALQEMMGYTPNSAPAGSEVWKKANNNWNSSVANTNATYNPTRFIDTPVANQAASNTLKTNIIDPKLNLTNNTTLNKYTDATQTQQNNFVSTFNNQEGIDRSSAFETQYAQGTKAIEVEKDELIFKKKGNRYILKADFKGGNTHAQGGEDYVATEGDVIFPGKDRKKVLNAYRKGDTSSLESMRMKLPKDSPKAQKGGDYTDSPVFTEPRMGFEDNASFQSKLDFIPFDDVISPNLNPITKVGNISGSNVPKTLTRLETTPTPITNMDKVGSAFQPNKTLTKLETKSPVLPKETLTNDFKLEGPSALSTGLELAPVFYNTFRGLSKPEKTQKNYYNPTRYQYTDISAPARRASQEAYNVDKYNTNLSRGNSGQVQNYLQQASNNKYKRSADIGNFEGSRKMDVFNKNIEQDNQAQLTNLQLGNQYNQQDAQNRARRNDFLASAAGQTSQFAQNRRLGENTRKKDEAMMKMDQKRLDLYNNMYDYEVDPDTGKITYKKKTYKKGTRKINRYK